jgi:rRNA maturation endonuclease Nob1
MPRGVCHGCGAVYHGWALQHGDTKCERCGGEVVLVGSLDTAHATTTNKEYKR